MSPPKTNLERKCTASRRWQAVFCLHEKPDSLAMLVRWQPLCLRIGATLAEQINKRRNLADGGGFSAVPLAPVAVGNGFGGGKWQGNGESFWTNVRQLRRVPL